MLLKRTVIVVVILLAIAMWVDADETLADVSFRLWNRMSQDDRVLYVHAMMHMSENLMLFAEFQEEWSAHRYIRSVTSIQYSVGDVVDLITEWYRRNPDSRGMPIAYVYMAVSVQDQHNRRRR